MPSSGGQKQCCAPARRRWYGRSASNAGEFLALSAAGAEPVETRLQTVDLHCRSLGSLPLVPGEKQADSRLGLPLGASSSVPSRT